MTKTKSCTFCQAKENELRPTGQYVVTLKKSSLQNQSVYARQSCMIVNRKYFQPNESELKDIHQKNRSRSLMQRLKSSLLKI